MSTAEHPSQAVFSPQQTDPPIPGVPSLPVDILDKGFRVAESVSSIWSFMHSTSLIAAARNLRGREAQRLIDLIDQACGLQLLRKSVGGTDHGCRFLHCRNWAEVFGSNVYTCFTNSAKPVNCCRLPMFYNKSLYTSVAFTVTADSRMSAKESTWDVAWLSNTSDSGRRMHSTRLSRYVCYSLSNSSSLLSLCAAVLPGNYRLEAPVPPQHLTVVGSLCLHGSPEFLHRLWLDAKWERDRIHQVQPRGKPSAVGKPIYYFLIDYILMLLITFSSPGLCPA